MLLKHYSPVHNCKEWGCGRVKSMFEQIYHLFYIIMFDLRVLPKKKPLPLRSGFRQGSPTNSMLLTAVMAGNDTF